MNLLRHSVRANCNTQHIHTDLTHVNKGQTKQHKQTEHNSQHLTPRGQLHNDAAYGRIARCTIAVRKTRSQRSA
jgi:hypothetical protein